MARAPVRLKNLQWRFAPFALLALLGLAFLEPRRETLLAGSVLAGAGAFLRSWAAGHLVKTRELACSGPYAYVRHPLYLGSLLCALGFAVAVAGGLGAALGLGTALWFAVMYLPRKDASESQRLEEVYGPQYVRYRAAVPAFWPRMQPWRPAAAAGPAAEPIWQPARWIENNELGALLGIVVAFGVVALRAV